MLFESEILDEKKTKIYLYMTLLIIAISSFILQIFVFEAPDSIIGFGLCLINIYLIFGSIIKLCKLNTKIKYSIFSILDLLFSTDFSKDNNEVPDEKI